MVQRPDTADPNDPDVLAEHGRFVRNLAWRLLHDEDAAEEVVQETMLAAVKAQPKTDRSLRPWLATVARNVIRRRFRSKDRVRRREEAAAKPEAVPSAFDMAARAEMLRDVVDAVLSLDEPNRSTVLLRFYEDLPPREIAAQQGVKVETVRGRIKRAIQQLRRRLDRRHGGPQGWMPLLAALTGLELPAELVAAGAGGAAGGTAAGEAAPVAAATTAGALPGLAAAFLVGAAVCVTAVVSAATPTAGTSRATTVEAPFGGPSVGTPEDASVAGAADEPGVDEDRFTAARSRRAELTARLATLGARLEGLTPAPGDPSWFRVGVAEPSPAFDRVKWSEVAKHVRAMTESLVEVETIVSGGSEPTLQQQSTILKHNTPVAMFAIDVGPELDTTDASLAFTHPTVVANLVRATLALLENPLSRDQEVALRALAEVWVLDSQAAFAAIPEDAPHLQRTLADLEAKMRFQAALKDVLTASQRQVLYFPTTEDRVDLDMLSPGILFPRLMRHLVHAPTQERLERGLVVALLTLAGVEVEDLGPYEWIGREWLAAIPEVLEPRAWYEADAHFPTVEVARRWLTQQVEAIHRVIGVGLLTESQAESMREITYLISPRISLPRPPPPPVDEDGED